MFYKVLPLAAIVVGCAGQQANRDSAHMAPGTAPIESTPAPEWLTRVRVDPERLCGFGVAGPGYNANSPYPRQLSEDRAVKNLAGALSTRIQEAFIDRETTHSVNVRTARAVIVDDALIEKVRAMARTEFWLDAAGEGPFTSRGFTYAHSCIDVKSAAEGFAVDRELLRDVGDSGVSPKNVPDWIEQHGKQSGGRLCAVGYSLPMYHADQTFGRVVEDVRVQLADIIQTFVSSYYEELATNRGIGVESMTLATSEGVAKGVVVTHYWYDRDGRGPHERGRTTYGWGCVYPARIIAQSAASVAPQVPEDEKQVIAQVQARAREAFGDLDAEIAKREQQAAQAEATPAP